MALIASGLAARLIRRLYGDVVELVDTIALEAIALVRAGASPAVLTINKKEGYYERKSRICILHW